MTAEIQPSSPMPTTEETIWRGNPSHLTNLKWYVFGGLCFWLVIPIFIVLWKWLEIRNFRYELTTERFRTIRGILNREMDELELYRVKDTSMTQPFFQRMFGLGSVVLLTSDKSTPELLIEAIPEPMQVRELIRAQVERLRDRKRVREVDFE